MSDFQLEMEQDGVEKNPDGLKKAIKRRKKHTYTIEDKEIIQISFSGGRTSAYMTYMMLKHWSDKYEFIVTFANTGREHHKTLDFINKCDIELGFNTVWLESIVNEEGVSCSHKIVSYETACRDGSVFENVIQKYGIPNPSFPHCTDRLKLMPMHSYLKSIGIKESHIKTAIGIRVDEMRRVRKDNDRNIIYPLVSEWPTDKKSVLDFWRKMPFDLEIDEFEGNCLGCFKKGFSKQVSQYKKDHTIFNWLIDMEDKYGMVKSVLRPRVFHRGQKNTIQLIKTIELVGDAPQRQIDIFENGGCSESCEVYSNYMEIGEKNEDY